MRGLRVLAGVLLFSVLAIPIAAGWTSSALVIQEPPAASDDRVPIPATIDSWYRVLQEGEHRGFYHEHLTISPKQYTRYEYFMESEYDITVRRGPGPEPAEAALLISESATAKLEEDFEVFELEYTRGVNDAKITMSVKTFPEENRRQIEVVVPGTRPNEIQRRTWEIPVGDPVDFAPLLRTLFYRLRQGGVMAQPGSQRVAIRRVEREDLFPMEIVIGVMEDRQVLEKPAKISPVSLTGGEFGPLPILTRYWIDKFGRVVEAATPDDQVRFVLSKSSSEAMAGTRGVSARGRRDPFSKSTALTPLTGATAGGPKGAEGPGGPKPRLKEIKEAEVDRYLKEAKTLVDQLREAKARADERAAEEIYQQFLVMFEALYPKVVQNVVQRGELAELKRQAESVHGGAERLARRAQEHLARINDFYGSDNLEGIDKELKALEELNKRPELFQEDELARRVDGYIREGQKKRAACQARIELAKKVLILTGVVSEPQMVYDEVVVDISIGGARLQVSEPVRVTRQVSYAVINNEMYKEGDVIPGEGVRVDRILRNAVQISYKGEVREVGMKK